MSWISTLLVISAGLLLVRLGITFGPISIFNKKCPASLKDAKKALTDISGNNPYYIEEGKGKLREHPEESPASSLLASEVAEYGIMTALADEHIELKNYEEAVRLAQDAIAMAEHAREKNNIYAAYAEGILANALYGQGSFKESAEHYRNALKVYEHHYQSTGGPESVELVGAMQIVAWNLLSKKEFEEAKQACATALGMTERLLGPNNADVAASMINLAIARLEAGDTGPGPEALLRRALETYLELQQQREEDTFTDTMADANLNVPISLIYQTLGDAYYQRGNDEEAASTYRKVEIMHSQGAIPDRRALRSLVNLAVIEWGRGNEEEAEMLLDRACRMVEKAIDVNIDTPYAAELHKKLPIMREFVHSLRQGQEPPPRHRTLLHSRWV